MARKPPPARPAAKDGPRPSWIAVERAAGELRRGLPVLITGPGGTAALIAAAETLSEEVLSEIEAAAAAPADILLTAERARTLKIRLYTGTVAALPREGRMDAAFLRALADPAGDLDHPLMGPFLARRSLHVPFAAEAVRLAKIADLLPAIVGAAVPGARVPTLKRRLDLLAAEASAIDAYETATALAMSEVASAEVPIGLGVPTRVKIFRPRHGGRDHVAILVGAVRPEEPVLVRLHSECFTGDLLGSLKCDCGPQLKTALARMAEAGGGVLLYLRQEGRGIGLANKLRAYELQEAGFDTVDANERLGFADDERVFAGAAALLKALRIRRIRLMTNNPRKLEALTAVGIDVVERVPLVMEANPHNAAYLAAKARRSGHLMEEE